MSSDTPITDEQVRLHYVRLDGEDLLPVDSFVPFVRKLERENAALKKAFAEADIVAEYERKDGRRDWWSGGHWLHTGEILVCIDRAVFDTIQRKEAQP